MNKNSQNHTEQMQTDTVQAQQKPVAWIDVKPNPFDPSCRGAASVQDHALPPGEHKLYATPQPPVQQEPVAWRVRPFNYGIGYEGVDALTTRKEQCEIWERKGWKVEPLYAAPQPPRQPLTDEQVLNLGPGQDCAVWSYESQIYFARAVEAAHGIGSTHG